MGLSERTKREMEAGRRALQQHAGPRTTPAELAEGLRLIKHQERFCELVALVQTGKVKIREEATVAKAIGQYNFHPLSMYWVGDQSFTEQWGDDFPSEELLARLILAIEFTPKPDPGD